MYKKYTPGLTFQNKTSIQPARSRSSFQIRPVIKSGHKNRYQKRPPKTASQKIKSKILQKLAKKMVISMVKPKTSRVRKKRYLPAKPKRRWFQWGSFLPPPVALLKRKQHLENEILYTNKTD